MHPNNMLNDCNPWGFKQVIFKNISKKMLSRLQKFKTLQHVSLLQLASRKKKEII